MRFTPRVILEDCGSPNIDQTVQSSWSRRRVLLAEDEPAMRDLLIDAIRADGLDVVATASGTALLDELYSARARGQVPDLIVSDVRMPGCTGFEVIRRVRYWGWDVPVILITAFGDEAAQQEAAAAGATVLFSKPFDIDDLRTAVLHFLPNRWNDPS